MKSNITLPKVTIFIDGSNLYGGLTELLKPGEYIDFANIVKLIKKYYLVEKVNFYGTYMRIDPTHSPTFKLIIKAQKKFFDSAKNCHQVTFFKGHFSGFGKEKGIDVKLALDMGIGACTNQFENAIIITGDADLKHAVKVAQDFSKNVDLVAIGSRFPFGIARVVSNILVLDYREFFKKNIVPSYKHKPKNLTTIDLFNQVTIKRVN